MPGSPAPRGRGRKVADQRPSKVVIKIAVALGALGLLGFLFMRTVTGTRAEPYSVAAEDLRGWTLVLESPSAPSEPVLVLRPPPDLVTGLFGQVFKRAMESMSAPVAPSIPLLLQGEFDRAFAGRVTPAALMTAAREAGLDTAPLVPVCLAHRRISQVGSNPQVYFVIFDAQPFIRFRARAAALLGDGAAPRADFDPAQLSPVLFIALAESTLGHWSPLHADAKADCVAPIVAAPPAH